MFHKKHISRENPLLCYYGGDMGSKSAAHKRSVGQIGEQIAADYLRQRGFTIVEMNYRKPWGEIDVIAEKSSIVHFVEVKSVTREMSGEFSREMGKYRPEEQVHPFKLKKVMRTSELYMNTRNDQRDFQIDVIAVILDMQNRTARCRFYEQVL